jgi:hypothetical protein
MDQAGMRAGDGDRQAVADQLKAALDDGRLDLGEYDDRLRRAYAARTYGELHGLLTDLPGTIPPQRSRVEPAAGAPAPAAPASGMPNWVRPYGGVVAIAVAVWVITSIAAGEVLYFWPVWMLFPLIFVVAGMMTGRSSRRDRRDR